MNLKEIKDIAERVKRIRKRLEIKDGKGTNWLYTFEDNETHENVINGVKPPEEVEDDITNTFIWLWNLKDYVKEYVKKKDKTNQWVEDRINSDSSLCICADIANKLKHGVLHKNTRSNKNPKLGSVTYSFGKEAIEGLALYPFKIEININHPEKVNLKMDVFDGEGKKIDEAFNLLDYGIKAWESIIDEASKMPSKRL